MQRMILVLSMCLFLIMISTQVYAAIIYVDIDAGGNNDGLDWANAFTNLQTALDEARNNADAIDEIWVADGTYYPGTARTDSFEMINGVGIYGGFSGVESTLGERDIDTNVTILSGDIGTLNDDTDNSYHVFYHNALIIDETAILDGFTVTGGNANGSLPHNNGGGIYYTGASKISNCTFKGNKAVNYGGGIHAGGSSTVFTNCSFTENQSGDRGGGMHIINSDMTFIDCTFSDNISVDDHGGGIYIDRSFPTFTNCIFSQNQAVMAGAMTTFNSAPAITDCTFSENKAVNVGGVWINGNSDYNGTPATFTNCSFTNNQADAFSGGLAISMDSVLITNCSFTENKAQNAGGIYNLDSSSATIVSCTFSGNSTTNNGAAIYNNGAPKIFSSLFIENIAGGDGGGIYTYHSDPETNNEILSITNCTFSLNQAGGYGGGIYSLSESLPAGYSADFPIPSPAIMNCIFWGDTAVSGGSEIYTDISTPMLSHNLIQGSGGSGAGWPLALGVDGGSNIDTDPMFADTVNFRLSPESPCVDSGNFFTLAVGVDIDLESRFFDGKGDGAVIVDIGADEFVLSDGAEPSNSSSEISNSSNDNDDSDNGCFISSLR